MQHFNVAGLVISVEEDKTGLLAGMTEYATDRPHLADINVVTEARSYIEYPAGELISEEQITWLSKESDKGYYLYQQFTSRGNEIATLVDVDKEWKSVKITYLSNNHYGLSDEVFTNVVNNNILQCLGVVFRYHLVLHNGIVLHASSIKCQDKGLAFTAPSGTGKSTHVRQWQQYLGEEVQVLNDDTPAIKLINDRPYIFGTPWGGSSGIHKNDRAPMEAMVILQQSRQNHIHRLEPSEALYVAAPRFFLPYVDRDLMQNALTIMEKIISTVPIYLLQCRPDKDAVELVYNCVM